MADVQTTNQFEGISPVITTQRVEALRRAEAEANRFRDERDAWGDIASARGREHRGVELGEAGMSDARKWGVFEFRGEHHVIPLGDKRLHERSLLCWCVPRADDGVWVHHSMDRREEAERRRARPS